MNHRLNPIFERYIELQRNRYKDWKEADCPVFDVLDEEGFFKHTVYLKDIKSKLSIDEILQLNLRNLYQEDRLEGLWKRYEI